MPAEGWPSMTSNTNVDLRDASEGDAPFVVRVIETTMRGHVEAVWGRWNEARVYEEVKSWCSAGKAQIVQVDGAAAGVLRIERHATHIQLEELLILPAYQGRGVGALLMRGLMNEARQRNLPLRLRVLRPNPAKRFYEQLGFAVVETTAQHHFMEYPPQIGLPATPFIGIRPGREGKA
jgi:GNAT superfamily N-acetyltransferase